MQAVPLLFLSGELQSAQQNGLCELGAGSSRRVSMLQPNRANTCTINWLAVKGSIQMFKSDSSLQGSLDN